MFARLSLPSPSPRLLGALAAGTLLAGFADLWRGGITAAPLLLITAYCILIPWAMWRRTPAPATVERSNDRTGATADRNARHAPSYGVAALVSLAVLALYILTLAPTTAMWDASEYITAAYTLGLPHPPGNPFFVLIGRVFAVLPIAPTVAVRINLLAAIASAASAGLWFLVAERIVAGWIGPIWLRRAVGAMAALIGATAFTVWNQSVVNEKVYTVSLVGLALVVWLAMRWIEEGGTATGDRLLIIASYVCGLGYANHMAGLLPAPALALAILMLRPRTLLRARLVVACLGALALGMSPFATQPIRSAHAPPINEGEPTACRTGIRVDCTFSAGTYRAFMYNFNREQYGKPGLDVRQAPFTAQVGMWWLYFKWQWLRDPRGEHGALQGAMASLFFLLALGGAAVHWRNDRRSFWFFGPFMATITIVLIYYLNFKYGASQAPALGDSVEREVRDRDYFYLWSYSALGVWVAVGLAAAWRALAQALGSATPRAFALAAPVLAIAFVPGVANYAAASRAGETATADFAHDLLNSVEPYGVLVTYGDNDTFPLWYAQEVEGVRRDVTVAVLSLLNTDWFVRGIIRRPIHPYDTTRGPAVYAGRTWPRPQGSPLHMTFAQADSIPEYVLVREPSIFSKGELRATIDPKRLPPAGNGEGVLVHADIAVLRMISDAWPDRPIYISRTTGNYADQLGLTPHLMTQGLARKLVLPPEAAAARAIPMGNGGWIDVDRTHALWRDTFRAPDSIARQGRWVDAPSVSIPYSFVLGGSELAEALRMRGDSASAARVQEKVERVMTAVGLADR